MFANCVCVSVHACMHECVSVCVCGSLQKALIGQRGATAGLQISAYLLVTESLKPAHLIKDNARGQIPFTPFTLIT